MHQQQETFPGQQGVVRPGMNTAQVSQTPQATSQYKTACPIATLGRSPAPVDCPSSGQRALTSTSFVVGNTTHFLHCFKVRSSWCRQRLIAVHTSARHSATFRDIRPSGSTPPETTVLQLKHLPLSYRHLPSDSPDAGLSSNLAKYLSRNGFTLSNDPQDCLNIIDYIRDPTEREKYHSTLLKGQVAICLVPNSDEPDVPESCTNIVFVNGPFSSSTLDSALQKANQLLAQLRSSTKTSPQPSPAALEDPKSLLTSTDPTTESDQKSTSDEGYDSVTGSSVAQRTTEALLNESIEQAVSQIEAATIDLPIRPLIPPATSKPMTLILVDHAVNLRILEMYCKKRGLPYLSAIDGHQAVELFKKQQNASPIDLILMDLQMPVCDGISATRQIRALEKTSNAVLFIVTGQDSQMDREAASKAGADNYLVKPVGIRMLDSSLERYFPDLVTS